MWDNFFYIFFFLHTSSVFPTALGHLKIFWSITLCVHNHLFSSSLLHCRQMALKSMYIFKWQMYGRWHLWRCWLSSDYRLDSPWSRCFPKQWLSSAWLRARCGEAQKKEGEKSKKPRFVKMKYALSHRAWICIGQWLFPDTDISRLPKQLIMTAVIIRVLHLLVLGWSSTCFINMRQAERIASICMMYSCRPSGLTVYCQRFITAISYGGWWAIIVLGNVTWVYIKQNQNPALLAKCITIYTDFLKLLLCFQNNRCKK